MDRPILTISGLRGIVGKTLTADVATAFARALGTLIDGGPVVIGRDGRASGPMLKQAVIAGLTASGCHVFDADIAATPTLGVLVVQLGARAGLEITASHNPIEWNGLKPFAADGAVFGEDAGRRLIEILEANPPRLRAPAAMGAVETVADAVGEHLARVLALVDVGRVRGRKLRVVLDSNHGAGSLLGARLLRELGCAVTLLGGTPDGRFAHGPEPLKENLTSLSERVLQSRADVGFAQDPDADRLAVVDHRGRYIGEELTIALCADRVLSQHPGPVVINGSSSRVTADIAGRHGCPLYRSWVGEAHVVAKMRQVGAVLGGEGNGGVIEPRIGYVRDSFAGMALILDRLATSGGSLADWVDTLPRYALVKQRLECSREKFPEAVSALERAHPDSKAELGDGLRLDWDDRWVQIRASNTEPIIRIIAEAPTEAEALKLCDDARRLIEPIVAD